MVKHQNGNFWLPASFAPFLPWLLQRSQRWKGSHLTFDLLDCETRSQLVAGAGPLSAEMLPVLGSAWGIAASRRCAKCDPSNVSVSLWIFFTSKKMVPLRPRHFHYVHFKPQWLTPGASHVLHTSRPDGKSSNQSIKQPEKHTLPVHFSLKMPLFFLFRVSCFQPPAHHGVVRNVSICQ